MNFPLNTNPSTSREIKASSILLIGSWISSAKLSAVTMERASKRPLTISFSASSKVHASLVKISGRMTLGSYFPSGYTISKYGVLSEAIHSFCFGIKVALLSIRSESKNLSQLFRFPSF